MIWDRKLVACAVGSVCAHLAIAHTLDALPERAAVPPPARVIVNVITPPAPEPPAQPAPSDPAPVTPPPLIVPPRNAPVRTRPKPSAVPPAQQTFVAPKPAETPTAPEFGISIESTSSGGGVAMQVGSRATGTGRGGDGTASDRPIAPATPQPVQAFETTKMPLPNDRCRYSLGAYTAAAQAAGTEGTVVLDLIVGADGRAGSISVVDGLPNGLTDAAIAALRACTFSPGERDGKPVAVKIRGFKIVFVLPS
jgi:protein TonB